MASQYVLAFCRVTIGLVFAWSFIGKFQDIPSFIQTINNFKIIAGKFHLATAIFFLGGELAVLGIIILGGKLLSLGFLLAGGLLILFSTAMLSTLIRKIQTPCNCFGASQKLISPIDIVRNIILIIFSFIGYVLAITNSESLFSLGWLDWTIMSIGAIVFVSILIQLNLVVQLFR